MTHAHYNRGDETYYCDVDACGLPFRRLEQVRDHLKTVHNVKRATVEDADRDPANQKTDDLDVGELLALRDAAPATQIQNFVPVTVLMKGQRRRFTLRIISNSESLRSEVLAYNLNLPPDTSMSPEVVEEPPADTPLATLFGALRELQSQFVYLQDPVQHELMALITIASFFREVFRTFPFVGFVSAERGWGKTTATKATIYPGYNGIFFTIPSEASFFRLVDDAHGMVGIDQVDDIFANPEMNRNLLALLDAAHQKGIIVPRCEKDDQGKQLVFFYEPFTIVAYNGTELIPPSLLSRSLVIKMTECAGRKQLRKNPIPSDFQCIRDQLYVWRLRHWNDVEACYAQLITQSLLLDRTEDIYLPLLTIAKLVDEELFVRVLEYAKRQYAQDRARRLNTWLQAFVELLPEFVGETEVVALRDEMNQKLVEMGELATKKDGEIKRPLGSRWIVKSLESLGFERCSRSGTGRTRYLLAKDRVRELQTIFADLLVSKGVRTSPAASLSSFASAKPLQSPPGSEDSEDSEHSEDSEVSEIECKPAVRPSTGTRRRNEDSEAFQGTAALLMRKLLMWIAAISADSDDHTASIAQIYQRAELDGYVLSQVATALEELKRRSKVSEVAPERYVCL